MEIMNFKKRFTSRVSVYLVLMQDDDLVLLALRKNTGFADGFYSLISGHLEEGETLREAVIREAREEVGIIISPDDLYMVHVMQRRNNSNDHYLDFYFKCECFKNDPINCEQDKCDHIRFFSINNLPGRLIDNVRCAFNHIKQNSYLSEL